jgi:hypothetical protein
MRYSQKDEAQSTKTPIAPHYLASPARGEGGWRPAILIIRQSRYGSSRTSIFRIKKKLSAGAVALGRLGKVVPDFMASAKQLNPSGV